MARRDDRQRHVVGESTPVMICGRCAACRRGRGNCANPRAGGCAVSLGVPVFGLLALWKLVRR